MNRRECLIKVAGAAAFGAAHRATAHGQQFPATIRILGIAFVTEESGSVVVHMPDSNGHRPFVIGTEDTVKGLCGSARDANAFNLWVGHEDIPTGSDGLYAECLPQDVREVYAGSTGRTSIDSDLAKSLPDLRELASKAVKKPKSDVGLTVGPGSIRLRLRGGTLGRPTQSKNPACAKMLGWKFYYKDVEVPEVAVPHITDVADFSFRAQAEVQWNGKAITLPPGQRLWIVNVPSAGSAPGNRQVLTHVGHHYVAHATVTAELAKFVAKTMSEVKAPENAGVKFIHPCVGRLDDRETWMYPPDTDPCFMMQF